jgi:hypothetical protein
MGRSITEHRLLSNRYRIEDFLGQGGMARVHRGKDLVLDRTVAVKLLADHLAGDPKAVRRFRREAQAAAGLNHPAIGIASAVASALAQAHGKGIIHRDIKPGKIMMTLRRSEGDGFRYRQSGQLGHAHPYRRHARDRHVFRSRASRRGISGREDRTLRARGRPVRDADRAAPPSSPTHRSPWPFSTSGKSPLSRRD